MEDLQSILERINRDGIEKANADAAKIIAEAKAEAEALIKAAKAESELAKTEAEKAAADYTERAKVTITQAARDTILKVENSVTEMLTKLLAEKVNAALADEAVVSELVAKAIATLEGPGEIAVAEKLAKALAAKLAEKPNFTIVTDSFSGSGFTVKTDGGRIEHSFTGETIAAELARRLRPDLAALLK